MPIELVLASASNARAQLRRQAGVSVLTEPASIDENPVKQTARGPWRGLIVGSDWFDKPPDVAAARQQLRAVRGQTHELTTAACVMRDRTEPWLAANRPQLTMRRFSDSSLEDYIAAEGDARLGAVGAYRLDGPGVQLFAGVIGDYFSVLGLPLIGLLEFLRKCGVLQQ